MNPDNLANAVVDILRPLVERIKALETKTAAIEAQPRPLSWQGVFQDGVEYQRGGCVTHAGSLWVCDTTATRTRPGTDRSGWKLIVKNGSLNP